MAGFASIADWKTAQALCRFTEMAIEFEKSPTSASATSWHSTWRASGRPAAGSFPSAGAGSAVTIDKTTVGAMPLISAAASQNLFLSKVSLNRAADGGGIAVLLDRLAHASVTVGAGTTNFSPVIDGTARLASGEGAFAIVEVHTALSSTQETFSLTYTNQAGTGSRATPNFFGMVSAAADRICTSLTATTNRPTLYVPLQAGDVGIRSIESLTQTGAGTGTITIAIVKPILMIPLNYVAASFVEQYTLLQTHKMPEIHDSSALFWVFCSNVTGTPNVKGCLDVVMG